MKHCETCGSPTVRHTVGKKPKLWKKGDPDNRKCYCLKHTPGKAPCCHPLPEKRKGT